MIRLENALEISLQKTSSKRLEDVLKTFLEDVWKTFWRRPEDTLKTSWKRLENVLKTSSRCLEDVWLRRYEDVLKRSSEDVRLRRIYSSLSRRLHQDECLLDFNHMQRHFFAETNILSFEYITDKLEPIFSRTQRFG